MDGGALIGADGDVTLQHAGDGGGLLNEELVGLDDPPDVGENALSVGRQDQPLAAPGEQGKAHGLLQPLDDVAGPRLGVADLLGGLGDALHLHHREEEL